MLTTLLLSLLPQQTLPAKDISWSGVRQVFPADLEMPPESTLPAPTKASAGPAKLTFEQAVHRLATEALTAEADGKPVYLAELIRKAAAADWRPQAIEEQLLLLQDRVGQETMELLRKLLQGERLYRSDWTPEDDTHDGIVFGPGWGLPASDYLWHKGTHRVEQAATLILADIRAIKNAEHDFPSYFGYIDNDYLEVTPRANSYFRCQDENGLCRAALLTLDIHSDLPFPFGSYHTELTILHRLSTSGELHTYLYGRGKDLYWLSGYDRLTPVRDAEGKVVATLLQREFGLDLRGVPDGSAHHQEGMRSSLGNLRRSAEARFDGDWNAAQIPLDHVPDFEVLCPQPQD